MLSDEAGMPRYMLNLQAAPWVRAKMQKEMEAGSWRGKAKTDETGRVIPNVLAQYREDKMRTTGLSPPSQKTFSRP